jgi:hypothetical protein
VIPGWSRPPAAAGSCAGPRRPKRPGLWHHFGTIDAKLLGKTRVGRTAPDGRCTRIFGVKTWNRQHVPALVNTGQHGDIVLRNQGPGVRIPLGAPQMWRIGATSVRIASYKDCSLGKLFTTCTSFRSWRSTCAHAIAATLEAVQEPVLRPTRRDRTRKIWCEVAARAR